MPAARILHNITTLFKSIKLSLKSFKIKADFFEFWEIFEKSSPPAL
nr:MAG TPA: hypothetical protein [Caudoviricetes sp.]